MSASTASKKRQPARESTVAPFEKFSPLTQDLLCILVLYVLCLVVFRGIIFNNDAFASGGDTASALSYTHAGTELEKSEGVDVLWMPYFFSGMPTFGNVAFVPHNVSYIQVVVQMVLNVLFLNGAWTWYIVYYFLGGVFMFLLMRTWRFGKIASLLAAVTFMLSPYAIGLAPDGHGSKLVAICYIPLVMMLTHLLFEKRSLLMFGLLSAALGTLLLTNHMQIVYYAFIVLGCYLVYHIVLDFKERKNIIPLKVLLLGGALLVGLCISSYIYLSVYEYSQYSMRGGGTTGASGGLTYDYATNWSWSLGEAIVLLIPGFYGINGSPGAPYWGHVEPWTYSYVYAGLIPILLAIIGLIYKRTRLGIFMAILTIFVVVVSLGRNFPLVYDIMFRVLPFFNKFRVPSMILHLLPFTLGVLGAIGYAAVEELRGATKSNGQLVRTMTAVSLVAGGLFLVSLLLKAPLEDFFKSFLFVRDGDMAQLQQRYGKQAPQALDYIKNMRFEIFWKDYVKFFILLAAASGAIVLYLRKTISSAIFASSMVLIVVLDLAIIDDHIITPQPRSAIEENFLSDDTIVFLKQQQGQFRIMPIPVYGNEWGDNTYAYHGIESIGGYSPAKLRIYQTMLDSCLLKSDDPTFPYNMGVIDMLNAKYFVVPGRLPEGRFVLAHVDEAKRLITYENPGALPRVWFVDTVEIAKDDHEVFEALDARGFDPHHLAVVQSPETAPVVARPDSSASANVTEHTSRNIVIRATTAKPALLVVSEVYYPAGWKAYVDGKETEIYRTNSVLRSVVVPSGTHTVTMTFDPPMYRAGWMISNTAWVFTALCIIVGLFRDPKARTWIAQSLRGRTVENDPAHPQGAKHN
ncbi:MAG TPA: YfhO family protein [Bacteroidota bacterium]|nr:YfhO family protein [Bacteroidota bacterium]